MSTAAFACIVVATGIFALLANVRDYKDFEADKKGGIRTLYVVLSERGISPQTTHRIVLGSFSLTYFAVLAYFGLAFHPPLLVLLSGAAIVACSLSPLMLVSPKEKTISSTAGVTIAAVFLTYTCFYLLPLLAR